MLVVSGAAAAAMSGDGAVTAINAMSTFTDGAISKVVRRAASAGGGIQARQMNGQFAKFGQNGLLNIAKRIKDNFNTTEFISEFANSMGRMSGEPATGKTGFSGNLGRGVAAVLKILLRQ